jgi:hypothetical protein
MLNVRVMLSVYPTTPLVTQISAFCILIPWFTTINHVSSHLLIVIVMMR